MIERNKMAKYAKLYGIVLLFVYLTMAGCGSSKPSRFYTLSPVSAGESSNSPSGAPKDITVGIGVVDFPDYLERPQIVSHISENELSFAEYERWAEPLKDNFTRVLLQNLSMMIPSDRIYMVPWKDHEPDTYQIILMVLNFEQQTDKTVLLEVRWSILYGESKNFLLTRKSDFREPVSAEGYDAIVAAMSRAIGKLSREIAGEVVRVAKEK